MRPCRSSANAWRTDTSITWQVNRDDAATSRRARSRSVASARHSEVPAAISTRARVRAGTSSHMKSPAGVGAACGGRGALDGQRLATQEGDPSPTGLDDTMVRGVVQLLGELRKLPQRLLGGDRPPPELLGERQTGQRVDGST